MKYPGYVEIMFKRASGFLNTLTGWEVIDIVDAQSVNSFTEAGSSSPNGWVAGKTHIVPYTDPFIVLGRTNETIDNELRDKIAKLEAMIVDQNLVEKKYRELNEGYQQIGGGLIEERKKTVHLTEINKDLVAKKNRMEMDLRKLERAFGTVKFNEILDEK